MDIIKIGIALVLGWAYLWKEKGRAYVTGYNSGYYQGRIDEVEAQSIALSYMSDNGPISDNEMTQIFAQQIARDPVLHDHADWDGIDRLALYQ